MSTTRSPKHKILFVCNYNSARSQMAEAFLKKYAAGRFESESSGLIAGSINPDAVKVMLELGIDLRDCATLSVYDLQLTGHRYDAIIALGEKETLERSPIFPGAIKRLYWFFDNPSTFTGNELEILESMRRLRDQIREKVKEFVRQASDEKFWKTDSVTEV